MNRKSDSAFIAVFKREILRMVSRRLYYGATIILPLFSLLFMATIFNNGQMENIPVGVVDMDQTATSRAIVRNVDAVPIISITRRFSNQAEAREATQRKDIYGYLVIPENFENRMYDGKYTTLNYYYHYALLSVGGEVLTAFENVLEPIAVSPIVMKGSSLGMTDDQISSFLMPFESLSHPLFNPDLDYSVYLSNPFFFIFLQILILLTSIYIVGVEITQGTAPQWLDTAKGNMMIGILGKFLPYTLIFCVIAVFANYIMFGPLELPFAGNLWGLILSSLLLVLASQALGLFVFCIYPNLGLTISIVSMIGSLGATLSGVTFPTPSMHPIVHYCSYLFPIRHYVLINQNILYGNFGFAYAWYNYVILLAFLIPPMFLLSRLKKTIISRRYEESR